MKEINLFKYFTIKRFLNVLKILSSFILSRITKKTIVWGMPLSYSIEPTNHCNLKCPECPSGLGTLTRPLGLLKLDNYKNWIDQIKNTGFYVQLFFQGEPFVHKDLFKMINYAQEKNVYVSISTNGLLLTNKNIDDLFKNPPDKLIFSIDGFDEESYQSYRVGGTFKNAYESLELLLSRKRKLNKKIPFVELQFIVMKQNEHQIEKVKEISNKLGVDKVVFKSMQVSSYNNALHFLPGIEKYRRYKLKDGKLKIKNKLQNHCFALWRTSVITWDGRVVPCCFDKDADFELGKLNGTSFSEIWKNEKYTNFRSKLLSDRKSVDMCTNCTEGLKMNILEIEQ